MGRQSDSYWPLLIGPERERGSQVGTMNEEMREGSEVGMKMKNAAAGGNRLTSH